MDSVGRYFLLVAAVLLGFMGTYFFVRSLKRSRHHTDEVERARKMLNEIVDHFQAKTGITMEVRVQGSSFVYSSEPWMAIASSPVLEWGLNIVIAVTLDGILQLRFRCEPDWNMPQSWAEAVREIHKIAISVGIPELDNPKARSGLMEIPFSNIQSSEEFTDWLIAKKDAYFKLRRRLFDEGCFLAHALVDLERATKKVDGIRTRARATARIHLDFEVPDV